MTFIFIFANATAATATALTATAVALNKSIPMQTILIIDDDAAGSPSRFY